MAKTNVLTACAILSNHRFNVRVPKNNQNRNNKNNNDKASSITTPKVALPKKKRKQHATVVVRRDICPTIVRGRTKAKRKKSGWWGKQCPLADQITEKESKEKEKEDNNASQASAKLTKSNTSRHWGRNIVGRRESLHNNQTEWASSTKKSSILLDKNGSTLSLFVGIQSWNRT
jgi:hypothetical protein